MVLGSRSVLLCIANFTSARATVGRNRALLAVQFKEGCALVVGRCKKPVPLALRQGDGQRAGLKCDFAQGNSM